MVVTTRRNYLEYVSDSIADWLKEKEAEYQATLLQKEVDKFKKEEEIAAKTTEKTQKTRKQSPSKSRSMSFTFVGFKTSY